MRIRVIVLAVFALLAIALPAVATPSPTFTWSVTGERTVSLNATGSVCRYAPCSYRWTEINEAGARRILGANRSLVTTFPTVGCRTVELRMSERTFRNPTNNVATTTRQVCV